MTKQEEREVAAKHHIAVMNVAFAKETAASIEGARIIEAGYAPDPFAAPQAGEEPAADAVAGEGEAPEPAEQQETAEQPQAPTPEGPTEISFASGDIVTAIFHAEKPVAVLDNASYRYPGGGYLRGWAGPEEDLCAEGNLQPILQAFQKSFYDANKQTASGELYTSRAIAVPDVMFTRHGEIASASVCVMAAPNRARALSRNRSERECDLALAERIDAAMCVLASFGAQTVILPAFGCGQMGNDATAVARLFREWIEAHEGVIPRVEFALWRGPDADAFKAVFADRVQAKEEPKQVAVAVEEDDEEEWDWEKYRISE
jgi:uncharacterized protein (TIGR02452 family)